MLRQSRGITTANAAPLVAVEEPLPSVPPLAPQPSLAPAASAPVAAPAAVSAPVAGPGTGAGTASGTGTGTGTGTDAGTSPAPPYGSVPVDLPPLPADRFRIGVRLTDASTRQPLAGVCVIVGMGSCDVAPRTNAIGVWAIDVPKSHSATQWDIGLVLPGYQTVSRRVVTAGQDVWLEIGLRRSR